MPVSREGNHVIATSANIDHGQLGQHSDYVDTYTPSLLHSIARADSRASVGLQEANFLGEDLWTGYEFSWLGPRGQPEVAGLRIRVPVNSPALVESKSMKLYLMSFAQTRFESRVDVLKTLDQDMALAFRAPVMVELLDLPTLSGAPAQLPGRSLDSADVRCTVYERDPDLLLDSPSDVQVREVVYTDVFRSLCPVTGQPDWASILIEYHGDPIDDAALLRYLVSYRTHPGFHETTIELIYADLLEKYQPLELSVYGRFLRRGGLDINPYRSSHAGIAPAFRLARQ